jgi:cell division protein FtsL
MDEDLTLEDLEKSEQMLKDSLFNIGHMAGLSKDQLEDDWQRIKLEASSRDIHIEEL